jgi:hypothetical protein
MTKTTINEIRSNFMHLVEYVSPRDGVDEVGEDPNMGGDPNAMGGADPNAMGGADPNAMGGADPSMGGDPNAMGGDPNAMGGADPSMGGDPNAMGGGQSPEGFAPQGVGQGMAMDGMGGDTNAMGGEDTPGPDDDVIEIDDLTDAQEDTEHKVDALTSKFERLMSSIDSIEKRINDIDAHTNQYLGSLKGEMEKRNPTPLQRLTMRSTKSSPYSMTPNEYMNNYAPENYSDESDNNGADDPQYKITKGDIDDFVDYNSIAKDIANNKLGLKDILGY